jgi:hypothetical protein
MNAKRLRLPEVRAIGQTIVLELNCAITFLVNGKFRTRIREFRPLREFYAQIRRALPTGSAQVWELTTSCVLRPCPAFVSTSGAKQLWSGHFRPISVRVFGFFRHFSAF